MKFNDVFIEEFNSKTLEDRTNTAQELFSWDLNKPFLSYQEKGCNIAIFKADWSDKLFFVFEYEENIYVPTNVTATRYILNQIRQSDFEYWLKCVNEYSDDVSFYKNDCVAECTIFTDCPYDKLLKDISDFFYQRHFRPESDVKDFSLEKESIYNVKWKNLTNDHSAWTCVYLRNDDLCIKGGGIEITINDFHSIISSKEFDRYSLHSIPKSLLEYFGNNIPNSIGIRFNNVFSSVFYDGTMFVDDICEFLRQKNYKAVLFSMDNEFLRIKNDKNLSTEEKFEKLHLYILNFMSDEALSPYEEIIKKVYGDCLSFITTPAKLFLLSGYYDAAIRKKTSSSIIDCSTITILFTKVVETEIENKIWLPYKRFFLQSAYFKQSFSQDLEDKDLNRFMRFLIDQDNKIKTPELGTTKYFLNTILNSKKRAQWSLVIKSFNDFCSTLNESSQQFLKDELPAILSEITTVYRNGSAHTKPLKLETALEYISKLEAGILKKILNIHP